jgi:hypothetical protein
MALEPTAGESRTGKRTETAGPRPFLFMVDRAGQIVNRKFGENDRPRGYGFLAAAWRKADKVNRTAAHT